MGIQKQYSEEVRLIHDASMPHRQSINDMASPGECHYLEFDAALKLVNAGSFMSRIDLKHGYRMM